MTDESALQQRMQKIGELVRQLDSEGAARSRELLAAVMELHGEALDRILQRLREMGDAGCGAIAGLAADPVVSSVLVLYGLHPLDFAARVNQAVEKARERLRPYGVYADLVGAGEQAVRLRLRGVDSSFTARTVRAMVEEELYAAAPDAGPLVVLGLEKFAAPDFVPLETLAAAGKV